MDDINCETIHLRQIKRDQSIVIVMTVQETYETQGLLLDKLHS